MWANRNDIPVGRANAISRFELCHKWKCTDRMVRHQIADFRCEPSDDGFAILSSASEPNGYWRSNDPAELRAFIVENENRARNTFVAVRSAKHLLSTMSGAGQMKLDVDDLPKLRGE